jgi:uncharacterized membrane protein
MIAPQCSALAAHPTLALVVGPLEFESPVWLWLVPLLGVATVLIGRRSIAGLDSAWRLIAMGVRLVVICLVAGALAEPLWREESKDVALTAIVDVSESIPLAKQREVEQFIEAARQSAEGDADALGVITTARDAFVNSLPTRHLTDVDTQHAGQLDATDLASAVRLAIATSPRDKANRILLVTDGNETKGDLLDAAEAAAALGVAIDVLPVRFEYDGEVLVDKLITPASAREGETTNVRVVLQASAPARGKVSLLLGGDPVDLDPSSDALAAQVTLQQGQNVINIPVKALRSGPQKYEAIFEPEQRAGRAVGDNLPQNNKSSAVTFVSGEGRVLVVVNESRTEEYQSLVGALDEANIRARVLPNSQFPQSLTELNAFDAVILVDQSAYNLSQSQQEDLRQYINDSGGGLIMIGGPQSYGAGGWIGSPVEEALPIRLDPPQKRQMPRGALVLCIHSCEIPNGVFYGKKVCEAAVSRLSRLDLVGINEYTGIGMGGGTEWVYPLGPVGDGTAVKQAINNLNFGDMPDLAPSFELSLAALKKADAGQKHMIVISDGDPSMPSASLLREFRDNRISVSTVAIGYHGGADLARMEEIAKRTGGRYYDVPVNQVAKLPDIFTKEAMTVKRALIWESATGAQVHLVPGASEALRGIPSVPTVNGYIVTAPREGLALITARVNITKDNEAGDPLLAQWQYGLGRVVCYTSDATTRWNNSWTSWQGYKQFWEQHVRWAMRPQGSANIRVITESKGDNTLVTVEALDTTGERLSFANFRGRLALPDGSGIDVELVQVAPGRYQTSVPTDASGSYVLSLRYAAPDANVEGGVLEGSVQASINRAFADEYRVLRDNSVVLQQVAALTKGRVIDASDPKAAALWSRELADGTPIIFPVAKTPIWLTIAILGIALFLMDVGVRRVRIDPAAIARWFAGLFGKAQTAQSTVGSMRAAREQARQRIQARAQATGEQLSASQLASQARRDVEQATSTAKAKFEATTDQLKELGRDPSIAIGGADARPQKISVKPRPTDPGAAGANPSQEGGMDRLREAKRKAREGMEDEA